MAKDLLKKLEAFQAETGLSDHRVGMLLAKNGRLLPRLREGGRIWPETIAEIEGAMKRERAARTQKEAS